MKRQMSFAQAESAGKTRVTWRQRSLDEMKKFKPWSRLPTATEPHYPNETRGCRPIGLERMLRICFLYSHGIACRTKGWRMRCTTASQCRHFRGLI